MFILRKMVGPVLGQGRGGERRGGEIWELIGQWLE